MCGLLLVYVEMGKKSAIKVEWGITPFGQILFEKRKDCWTIVRNFQTISECVNGRRVLDIILIKCESFKFCRDTWLSLDMDG